jgi:hypothetical protein
LQGLLLQIDITEIIVHKADQPDTVVDLFDTHSLTRERGTEIDFLFVDADSSAAGNQSGPIVERIGEFSDAAIGLRGGFLDVSAILHAESFLWAFVVKFMDEGIELGLLLKEVGTRGAGWLPALRFDACIHGDRSVEDGRAGCARW